MSQVARVPLAKGGFAVVDAEDLPLVEPYHWYADRHGYAVAGSGPRAARVYVKMHRVVLGLGPSRPIVDHINRNPLDNRRANLRIPSFSGNSQNSKMRSHNTSGFRGVSAVSSAKWGAWIRLNGRSRYLGRFDSAEEAARAYDEAARDLHGAFAVLNFP